MGLEPSELDKTVYEAILVGEPMPIHQNLHNMDLAAANINLSGAELELVVADMRDVRLKVALKPLRKQYDFILVDCPPSLGISTSQTTLKKRFARVVLAIPKPE